MCFSCILFQNQPPKMKLLKAKMRGACLHGSEPGDANRGHSLGQIQLLLGRATRSKKVSLTYTCPAPPSHSGLLSPRRAGVSSQHCGFRIVRPLSRRLASKREETKATRPQAPEFKVIKFHCSKQVTKVGWLNRQKTDLPHGKRHMCRKKEALLAAIFGDSLPGWFPDWSADWNHLGAFLKLAEHSAHLKPINSRCRRGQNTGVPFFFFLSSLDDSSVHTSLGTSNPAQLVRKEISESWRF